MTIEHHCLRHISPHLMLSATWILLQSIAHRWEPVIFHGTTSSKRRTVYRVCSNLTMAQPSIRRFSLDHRNSFDSASFSDIPPKSPGADAPAQADVRPQPDPLAEEPIARMISIAPCIFVPLETDITKPRESTQSRVEKLERLVGSLQARRPEVLENMAYMAERERLAILQFGRQQEALTPFPTGPGPALPPEEVDWTMDNMNAPAPRDKDISIKDEAGLQQLLARVAFNTPPGPGPTFRESVAADLLQTVTNAAAKMKGYSTEVDMRIMHYTQMLEDEKRRLETVGKRPEER